MPGVPGTLRSMVLLCGLLAVMLAAAVAVHGGLPVMPAVAAPTVIAAFLWYRWDRPHELRRRRRAMGLCVGCGYDLTGNVSGVCPECGTSRSR